MAYLSCHILNSHNWEMCLSRLLGVECSICKLQLLNFTLLNTSYFQQIYVNIAPLIILWQEQI